MNHTEISQSALLDNTAFANIDIDDALIEMDTATEEALGNLVVTMFICSGARTPNLPCAAPNSCALEGFCQYPGR